ncbi:MAG: permease [Rhodothermales bacterium]
MSEQVLTGLASGRTGSGESGRTGRWVLISIIAALLWIAIYPQLDGWASAVVTTFGLSLESRAGEALHFFLYDTPKILMLLAAVVYAVGIVQSFFSPERTRALLSGRRLGFGNTLAAGLGVVTPFCSCSAVPLFIGFLSAGVPLGVTFSFLVAAPMVNEIALALLFGLFGWRVAIAYLALGLAVAVFSGLVIGRLKMERFLEDWVQKIQGGQAATTTGSSPTWERRFELAWAHVKEIFAKVWVYVLIGIAVGALIHGYVPESLMVKIMGRGTWWSVPAAVVLGIPMYSNAAGILPVVEALIGKGAAMGSTLAFMMSVTALSLPEMLILRKVLKPTLIWTFITIVGIGILLVGVIFNLFL